MSDNLLSRVESILQSIIDGTAITVVPQSRVEILLVQLSGILGGKADLVDGVIPINELPPVAFANCVTVDNDTERYALTTDDVQNGDVVYVNSSQTMYFVVDDTKLDVAAGYKALAAGIAAQAIADANGNDIPTTYETKNNTSRLYTAVDGQQNTTASGGNGYALINGIRLYVASSAPTGNIPDGSVGVGW